MRCAAATMSAPKTKLMDVFAPSGGYIQKTCTYIGGRQARGRVAETVA